MNNLENKNIKDLDAFKNLTDEEKALALQILGQMASTGESEILDDLKFSDFEEIPVDIDTFLDDDRYLGKGLWAIDQVTGERKCTLFPYWREMLRKLFPDNLTTSYNTLILTGCLAYDTEIPLLNGKIEKIGELAKKENLDEYVYSYDIETNQYVPGHLIKAFSTGIKPVYEIELDNGTKIKATSNHKFMTRDKHWKSIDSGLAVGDSMMPFNTYLEDIANRSGYEVIENPNKDGTSSPIFTHRLVMNWKRGQYKGVVHHKDFNKCNNDPRNLVLTDWATHRHYHAKKGGIQFKAFNVTDNIVNANKANVDRYQIKKAIKISSHKIKSIKFIGNEEVFDLTVEKYHNFAINKGIIAHNSIGLGKTQCAVLAILYLLYRMLCLKDPYGYYGMMPIDKITFSLLNITIDTAKGVAWDKLQQLLQNSEWFMTHGSLNASRVAPTWQPDKHIELIFGSSNNHVIGRALFCLDGETEILTTNGVEKIKELVNKPIQVWNLNNNNNKELGPICTVKPTLKTNVNYQIELADGSVINCTSDHLFKLTTGAYKKARDLTIDDELAEPKPSYFEFIDNIIQTRGQFGLSSDVYWEGHHIIPKCLGGTGNSRHKDPNIIRLLPEEHYVAHKLLAEENPENKKLVSAFEMMIHPKGKTKRCYEVSSEDYALAKRLWSEHMKNDNPGSKKTGHPWNYGQTKETDIRIKKQSISQTGKNTWTKNRVVSKETRYKMSQAVKSRYAGDPNSFCKKGNYQKKCITNGKINKYINSNNNLPNGYIYGMARHSDKKYKFSTERKLEYSKKFSGKNNPMYGNGKLLSGGRNGHATIRYFYDNLQFECRKDLLTYLQGVDPKVVSSTIRKLLAGSERVRKEHPILAKLHWEEK